MEGSAMISTKQLGVDGCQLLSAVTLAGGALHVESLSSLAEELGSTHKKVRTALGKLVAAGVVEVNSRRNAGTEIRLVNLQQKKEVKPTEKPEQVKPKREKVKQVKPSDKEVKQEPERPKEYWENLKEKFAPVLFERSESWSNNLRRKWLRLIDDFGEDLPDRLITAVMEADWIKEKQNLSLSLMVANADKILAGRYGRIFEGKKHDASTAPTIKRSKAAICQGGETSKSSFTGLFE